MTCCATLFYTVGLYELGTLMLSLQDCRGQRFSLTIIDTDYFLLHITLTKIPDIRFSKLAVIFLPSPINVWICFVWACLCFYIFLNT
jgi:hypothetical protein